LDREASKLPPRSGIKRDAHGFPVSPEPETKKVKRKRELEPDDETQAFLARPTAVVNRPMVNAPVDRTRKYAIELSMAQVDPSASFEERVAQFDQMEAVAKKRKLVALFTEFQFYLEAFRELKARVHIFVLAANEMPEDVVQFLEKIFANPLHTWNQDPGYSTRITSMCPPPSNSKILVILLVWCEKDLKLDGFLI
jgi:hypothetical protein